MAVFRVRLADSVRLRAREIYGRRLATEIRKIIRQPPRSLDLRPTEGLRPASMTIRIDDHTAALLDAISKTSGFASRSILARIVEHLVQTAGDTEA